MPRTCIQMPQKNQKRCQHLKQLPTKHLHPVKQQKRDATLSLNKCGSRTFQPQTPCLVYPMHPRQEVGKAITNWKRMQSLTNEPQGPVLVYRSLPVIKHPSRRTCPSKPQRSALVYRQHPKSGCVSRTFQPQTPCLVYRMHPRQEVGKALPTGRECRASPTSPRDQSWCTVHCQSSSIHPGEHAPQSPRDPLWCTANIRNQGACQGLFSPRPHVWCTECIRGRK